MIQAAVLYNNLTHFWDKVDIVYVMHFSDVTLLFEQWIIFKHLQFILLFYAPRPSPEYSCWKRNPLYPIWATSFVSI